MQSEPIEKQTSYFYTASRSTLERHVAWDHSSSPLGTLRLRPPLRMSRYPNTLGPATKLTKAQKNRARREPSGVFSLFQAPQIQQFKEAFQLIDHDKDGWVGESDLKEIFGSLGTSWDSCIGCNTESCCRNPTVTRDDARAITVATRRDDRWRAWGELYDVSDNDE